MRTFFIFFDIKHVFYYGVFLLLITSCAAVEMPLAGPPAEGVNVSSEYLIGAEDVVEVMVWKNADLSRTVNVRPDGKISLPLIGDVPAAGLSAEQLRINIVERFASYYKEPPQVSVIVQQVNSYAIYILGEVKSPGKYVVKTGTTFLQAVTLAGGFTDFASKNRIVLRRKDTANSDEVSMNLKYKDIVYGKQKNIMMMPGDTIIVP